MTTAWLHPTGPVFLGGFAMFCNCFGSIRQHFGPRRLCKDQVAGNLALIEAELMPDIRSGCSIIPKTLETYRSLRFGEFLSLLIAEQPMMAIER